MKSFLPLIILLFSITAFSVKAHDIEFIIHHAPGGPSDKVTRIINNLSDTKYKTVNRPGAQGKIAVKSLLNSNNLMLATMPQIFVTNFLMQADIGYKIEDLELIFVVGTMPNILVCNSNLGFKSYKDFLSIEKSLTFGVAGYGSSEHIATEILFKKTNKSQHIIVPYAQGGATSLTDLLGGNIDCMFANYPLVKEYLNDTRIKALISTHNLNLAILTWQQFYKNEFPYQSHLGIVVSKNINKKVKEDILKNINSINTNLLRSTLNEVGIFPLLKYDKNSLLETINETMQIKQIISNYHIRIN